MTVEVTAAESLLVMLTEMKGDLKLVLQRMDDIVPRVERHDIAITSLLLSVQGLSDGMVARDRTAIEKAQALKDAKDAQEATGRAEAARADTSWSPASKLIASIGSAVAVLAVLWAILSSLPTPI